MNLTHCSRLAAFALALGLAPAISNAITISADELPSAVQACTTHGSGCTIALTSTTDIGGMSAFRLREGSGISATTSWLLRYSLYEPSTASLPGYMWLRVQEQYSLSSDAHAIALHLDYVDPSPASPYSSDTTWNFTLSTAALLAGTGAYSADCCNGSTIDTSLLPLNGAGPLLCAAEGCAVQAQLNFVNFFYTFGNGTARLMFDSTDDSTLLYSQTSSYDGRYGYPYFQQSAYFVAPVPLPAAAWLLLSALPMFGFIRRKIA